MRPLDAWVLPPGTPLPAGRAERGEGPTTFRYALVDPGDVRVLSSALRRRATALRDRDTASVAGALGAAGQRFADAGDPLREEALARLPGTSGFSPAMARAVVDGMARDWTTERITRLVEAELPDPRVLDVFVPDGTGRRVRAMGPALTVHVGAGNVPGVGVSSLIRSLLVRSPVLLKPGAGDVVLPVLFARALAAADPELGACVAVLYWPGGSVEVEDAALEAAEVVVVYGGLETVRTLRSRMPVLARLVAYHHRISFALVGRAALTRERAADSAGRAARAVALFDQHGCVSPHVVWVEEGGEVTPGAWAEGLAGALDRLEGELPGGSPGPAGASARHQALGTAEIRAAAGSGVRVFRGEGAGWVVVYDPDPGVEASCLDRFVRVAPLPDASLLPSRLAPLGSVLQSVALEGLGDRREGVAEGLARVGAQRLTSLEALPWPPGWWHHDGQGPLRALLRWVDLERSDPDAG